MELFSLHQRRVKQNSLALDMRSALAPQSAGPSVFTVHQDSIWEAPGRAGTFPSALPTCSAGSETSAPGGVGPALRVGGGYGAENEKPFIKKNLAMRPFPALVSPKIILASLIELDKGWGLGKGQRKRREGEGTVILGNLLLLIETICSLARKCQVSQPRNAFSFLPASCVSL